MQKFYINLQQLQSLINVLGEFPAKQTLASIDMLRNLEKVNESTKVQDNPIPS
jgi:hypothetical protein